MAGSIVERPEVQEESRSFCCLPSWEEAAAALRVPRPLGATSRRGRHGPSSTDDVLGARAGVGETAAAAATREQGRCLSPTSELFAPTSPCVLSRSPKTPALGPEPVRRDTVLADPQAASAPVQARPPPAGAGNHFLFGPNFGDCQLPGPARVSLNFSGASSPRKTAWGTRGEGRRGSARRPGPGHGPGCTPACPGVGGAGRREEGVRVTSLVPPLPITASAPPTYAP